MCFLVCLPITRRNLFCFTFISTTSKKTFNKYAMAEQMVTDLKDMEPQLKKVKEKSPYSVQLF